MPIKLSSLLILICTACLVCAAPLLACSTPVFRYALENWPAAPYELVIFSKGELPKDLAKIVDDLRNSKDFAANIILNTIDANNIPEEYKKPAEAIKDQPLPWMVLRYPSAVSDRTIWSGPLKDRNSIVSLVDSPARQQIAKHMAAGDGAVWVLVDCGKESDDTAAKLVESQVKEMSQQFSDAFQAGLDAQVPPPFAPDLPKTPDDPKAPALPAPVAKAPPQRIGCTLVRIHKNDKVEELFVRILTEHRPDTEKKESEHPRLYMVFGRGRMLGPLVGAEITEQNVQAAAGFLTGPCMCEIKAQNPGIDLLMNTDWDQALDTLLHGPQPQAEPAPAQAAAPAGAPLSMEIPKAELDKMSKIQQSTMTPPPEATAPPVAQAPAPLPSESIPTPGTNRIFIFAMGLIAAGVLVVVVSMREKRRLD